MASRIVIQHPMADFQWARVGDRIGFGDADSVQAHFLDQVERVEY